MATTTMAQDVLGMETTMATGTTLATGTKVRTGSTAIEIPMLHPSHKDTRTRREERSLARMSLLDPSMARNTSGVNGVDNLEDGESPTAQENTGMTATTTTITVVLPSLQPMQDKTTGEAGLLPTRGTETGMQGPSPGPGTSPGQEPTSV